MRVSNQSQPLSNQTGIRQRSVRKHCRLGRATELVFVLATGLTLVLAGDAKAVDKIWDTEAAAGIQVDGGTRLWDSTKNTDPFYNWTLNTLSAQQNSASSISSGHNAIFELNKDATTSSYSVLVGDDTAAVTTTQVANVTVKAGVNLTINPQSGSKLKITGSIDVQDTGTLVVTAELIGGALTKTGTGTLTLSGTNTYTGATTISGGQLALTGSSASASVAINSNGTLTTDGALANAATVNVTGAGELVLTGNEQISSLAGSSSTGKVTLASHTLTVAGDSTDTTFAGVVAGAGGVIKTGTGTLTLSGTNTYTGATTISGGELDVTGSIASASVAINSGGTLKVDGASLADTAAVVVNAGGTLELGYNEESIGSLTLEANSTVKLNVNLASGTVGKLVIAGTTPLAVVQDAKIAFNVSGIQTTEWANAPDGRIPIITHKITDETGAKQELARSKLNITGLPRINTGAFDYELVSTGKFETFDLQSSIGSGIASLAAAVGLTQTVIGGIVNRPTSPYVGSLASSPEEDPCGQGNWARLTGGYANAEGRYTDAVSGKSGTAPISLNYRGLQVGTDFACFGGKYNGWDMAFGGIAGLNSGSTSNNVFKVDSSGVSTTDLLSITTTSFGQKYGGAYVTASRGRFFSDLQYRYDDTEYTSTNTAMPGEDQVVDLTGSVYNTKGSTISGSLGYSFPIGEPADGLSFVSSTGFALSDLSTGKIGLGNDGDLKVADTKSRIGFLSGTVAKSAVRPDGESLLSYFGTFTLYDDFGNNQTAVYTPASGVGRELTLSNAGKYSEFSTGFDFVRVLDPGKGSKARQLNANIRVDTRVGDDLDSMGIAAQFRLQF